MTVQPSHAVDATPRLALHHAVLADMAGSKPKRLVRALEYQADDIAGAGLYATEADFQQALRAADSGDQLLEMWRKQLMQWDFADNPAWSTTEPRTEERRIEVYRAMAIETETVKLLDNGCPLSLAAAPVVISKRFTPWRTKESSHGREWYWPHYNKLLSDKGWPQEAIAALDIASESVVERLADPTRSDAYQSKGLVVGYVQSGKTANFTGVIAKAIDAGYRLVIVLGGTLNLLRDQTQRRLDKELVGRENILRGASEFEADYYDDPEWIQREFVEFGAMPSVLGGFDIVRLTTRGDDYKALLQGIVALEFEKQEPALPLWDARNLHRSSARLMVVKKNKTVLGKLVRDLKKIRTPLDEIPVLIIDDESDEASVNTSRPKPDVERTAINQKISELLTLLPRAQYVGYTATPYANVFIDPSDTADIFPKDFIISLPRPKGYMGAADFHDLDAEDPDEVRTYANSNELAHVRDVIVEDEDDTAPLERAIDMFVLAGAMKLYRQQVDGLGDGYFRHHTMLIHESNWVEVHRELSGRVNELWWRAGYSSSRGHERLRALFDSDVAPVSLQRAGDFSIPASYDDLQKWVGVAVQNISGDQRPILVINGDKDLNDDADFDRRSIWKILIGGQKLSRGFTVEGLTVSYFRRRSANASALMQMGRWFGFRKGYRDLVRLYIGRDEDNGKQGVDLYKAFEAVCMDEESFRTELEQYAVMVDGVPQVTPAQVPPLVSQHLPTLRPTSPNKMYNAKLVEIRSPGLWREPFGYPNRPADLRHNTTLWSPVFDQLSNHTTDFTYNFPEKDIRHRVTALTGILAPEDFLEIVHRMRWLVPGQFDPHIEYLDSITRGPDRQVDDWLVLAPQTMRGATKDVILGSSARPFTRWERVRRRDPLFGAISTSRHRSVAMRIAGGLPDSGDPATERLVSPRRGTVMIYPVVEPRFAPDISPEGHIDPGKLVIGFGFVAPASARGHDDRVVRFTTHDSSDDAIVEVCDGE